jgi:WD40 repeat protein
MPFLAPGHRSAGTLSRSARPLTKRVIVWCFVRGSGDTYGGQACYIYDIGGPRYGEVIQKLEGHTDRVILLVVQGLVQEAQKLQDHSLGFTVYILWGMVVRDTSKPMREGLSNGAGAVRVFRCADGAGCWAFGLASLVKLVFGVLAGEQVYAATFHPDKATPLLATASADSKIMLWSSARTRE